MSTLTESDVKATLSLRIVSTDYPIDLRPQVTNSHDFWSSENVYDRTFFVCFPDPGMAFLVLHDDDPRAEGMRKASTFEKEALAEVGLDDPEDHSVWAIESAFVQDEPESLFFVGQRVEVVGWGSTPDGAGWNGPATIVTPQKNGLISVRSDSAQAVGAFDKEYIRPLKEDKVTRTFTEGQSVDPGEVRHIRGMLLTRRYNPDQKWITHGDGSATRIEGGSKDRMGLGLAHPTYTPEDSWVNDGWLYLDMDESRVPEDEATEDGESVLVEGEPKSIVELAMEVERLKAENSGMARELADAHHVVTRTESERDAARTAAREARQQHEADIRIIGEKLLEEAESRSWCEVFDEIVSEVNGGLTVLLPTREQEFEVPLRVEFTITKTVKARSESEAREEATDTVSWEDVRYMDPDDVTVTN